MKKMLSNRLFIFIISGVFFASVTLYAANIYYANEIKYTPTDLSWNVTDVNEALNDLYNKYNNNRINIPIISLQAVNGSKCYLVFDITNKKKLSFDLSFGQAGAGYILKYGYSKSLDPKNTSDFVVLKSWNKAQQVEITDFSDIETGYIFLWSSSNWCQTYISNLVIE